MFKHDDNNYKLTNVLRLENTLFAELSYFDFRDLINLKIINIDLTKETLEDDNGVILHIDKDSFDYNDKTSELYIKGCFTVLSGETKIIKIMNHNSYSDPIVIQIFC